MNGWIKLKRNDKVKELLKDAPCFLLLSQIAFRAKRTNDFSVHNLEIGEAMIGDYSSCGLTEQKYRTAKNKLTTWKFITIRATTKGTVAKLLNKDIWDINEESTNGRPTDDQRTTNGQLTTNKNVRMKECKKPTPPPIPFIDIINILNSTTGKKFRLCPKTNSLISARWNEDYRLPDFEKVIKIKTTEWKGDSKMEQYLRPMTLFGTKFESYLNQNKVEPSLKDKQKEYVEIGFSKFRQKYGQEEAIDVSDSIPTP